MDNISQKIISCCEQDTENFAAKLAQTLTPGTVVTLDGDLGAGKTVFARGFARGLGITDPVSSPTYTIVQEYPLPQSGRLYHMDLYRIDSAAAALAFGVDEFFDDSNAFSLVEWPARAGELIPDTAVKIFIRHLSETEREIIVSF